MYMQLGAIVFEPLPITGQSEEHSWEYPEHAVIEGKPLLQFIAANLDVTTLDIRLHVSWCDPAQVFTDIKALADSHAAQRLISGDGIIYGMRVITRLAKTLIKTADNGRPLLIEAQLTLKEWVDTNPLGSRQTAQQQSAPALGSRGPIGKVSPQDRGQAIIAGGIIKTDAAQTGQAAKQITSLADLLPASVSEAAVELAAFAGQIQAAVTPVMQSAQQLAAGVQGAAAGLQDQVTAISGFSSEITRITSGLPYPASIIGDKIAAWNQQISDKATKGITLTSLGQGGAIEAGTRAQMITRMLPGDN